MAHQVSPPASTGAPAPPAFQPYVPASQSPAEFTLKAVIIGVLFGLLFGASTVYLGLRAGLTVKEVPIEFIERERGDSKMSGHVAAESLIRITIWGLHERWNRIKRWFRRS